MRNILTLVAILLSLAGYSQTIDRVASTIPKWTLGLNAGFAVDDAGFFERGVGPFRSSLGMFRNLGNYQLGLAVEAGINAANRGYLAPVLVANRRLDLKRGYFYGGIAAGGFAMQAFRWTGFRDDWNTWRGYTAGLQLGYVHTLNKRFALTSELGFRYAAAFHRFPTEEGISTFAPYYRESWVERWDILSVPVTVGIRYNL